jgi:hypothetical protein
VLMLKGKYRGRRPGSASFVSCLLLMALLVQATPFVIPDLPSPSVDATADRVSRYFEPLQVCDNLRGPGILLSDIPWIPSSPQGDSSLAEAEPFFAPMCPTCPEGFLPSPYRPPRPFFPLS